MAGGLCRAMQIPHPGFSKYASCIALPIMYMRVCMPMIECATRDIGLPIALHADS